MLFHFIGETNKAYTNVISIAYKREADVITFAVSYSNKKDHYQKHIAQDLLFNRFLIGHTFDVDFTEGDKIETIIRHLQKIHGIKDAHSSRHPKWAKRLINDVVRWDYE